ncbi:flagellar biosynthetic protein FliR [Thalassoroseus pseudoceratinae]|uniref:flagellar biosynthetic protein FliR n=1 Tax=Thalassoroseus pseudoceratinae TaxID=2713176 RepID=UPI00141ECF7D|nr:flagellar biosynthetic protein FliR [Thalassoroseus pseudoceratinae]
MDFLQSPSLTDFLSSSLVDTLLVRFYIWVLVFIRLSGLMILGPLFGTPAVPIKVRALFAVSLSVVVAPLIPIQEEKVLIAVDRNHDQRISQDEVPENWEGRYRVAVEIWGEDSVGIPQLATIWRLPLTVLDFTRTILGEIALGFVLGLGVFTVLCGLQLAGEMIDQQAGTALGEVFNPGLGTNSGLGGQAIYMFGMTVFLVMTPLGGHLMILSALLDTFQILPVGEAWVSTSVVSLLIDLVHQSLVIAIQVAAPVLATTSLIALVMGFLGHTTPQINVLVVGFPIRATATLIVFALSFSGAARLVIDLVPLTIRHLTTAMANS